MLNISGMPGTLKVVVFLNIFCIGLFFVCFLYTEQSFSLSRAPQSDIANDTSLRSLEAVLPKSIRVITTDPLNIYDPNNHLLSYADYKNKVYRLWTEEEGEKRAVDRWNKLTDLQKNILQCTRFNVTRDFDAFKKVDFEMAQSEHHPSYKNPCWMEPLQHRTYSSLESTYSLHRFDYLGYLRRNSHLSYIVANGTKSQLRCLPYYYIVGTSKCGSTDLHQALERHPAIVAGALKEPKWLIKHRVGLSTADRSWSPLSHYVELYDGAAIKIQSQKDANNYHGTITGDASVGTIHIGDRWPLYPGNEGLSEPAVTTAHHLRNILPDIKLIFIVRNPTDRLYSQYNEDNKKKGTPEDFHVRATKSVELMNHCLESRPIRECAYDPCYAVYMFTKYARLRAGLYGVYLADWLRVFPHNQIRLYTLDEYKESRSGVLKNITDFLEIENYSSEMLGNLEHADVVNAKPRQAMLPETREMLVNFYRPFNKQLVQMMNDSRFEWPD